MKHLQYFQRQKRASIDISIDASGSENNTRNDIPLRGYKQTLAGSEATSNIQNVADSIRNYCLYILMFALTGYAVVSKLKSSYEKNVLATKEGLKILRAIFLAGRNIVPAYQQNIQSTITAFVNQLAYGDLPERLLTQFKAIAPGLYAQIDSISVTSEAVVSVLWQYTFSIGLPY
jgi:hypothetical protein